MLPPGMQPNGPALGFEIDGANFCLAEDDGDSVTAYTVIGCLESMGRVSPARAR